MTVPSSLNFIEGNELPSTPAAGRRRLYAKAAGWYDLDDGGIESQLLTEAAADLIYLTEDAANGLYDALGAAAAAQAAAIAHANSLVVGLWDDRGNYNASGNVFPSSGGSGSAGAILKGDVWTVSVAGTVGGQAVEVGDLVRALVDTPGQTAGNWAITEHNLGYVALNAASNLSDLANAGTARSNLGLGTAALANTGDFDAAGAAAAAQAASQPLDATLTALAAANWAANALPIGSGADALSQVSFAANTFPARASTGNLVAKAISDFGLSLVDDADAAAGRSTLGLGTAAVQNTGTSGANVPLLNGANTWGAQQTFADVVLGSANSLAWSTDLFLVREGAGILAQRNGTNIQTHRIYGTYTDASNYERFSIAYNGAFYVLATANAGTGLAKGLYLKSAADFIYFEASQLSMTNAAGTAHVRYRRIGDGWLGLENAAGTGFTALQFGAADGVSPSLRPNGSTLEVGAVNNTQYGPFAALSLLATSAFQLNGGPGTANSCIERQFIKTGLADAVATAVITVTVPNSNQSAVLKMRFISTNGGADAFESTRTAEAAVIIARTPGVDTAKTEVSIGVAGIATVASGATHTLAYTTSALTGASSAQQTFTVNVTLDDNGSAGSNQVMVYAWLHNNQNSGVTMAAA